MKRVSICALSMVVLCSHALADFRVEQVMQVPTAVPGQQVYGGVYVDSRSNFIVPTLVNTPVVTGSEVPIQSYSIVKKIDPNGREIFARVLPNANVNVIAIDSHDDIYVVGTAIPDSFPFANTILTVPPTQDINPSYGFAMKFRGEDGTLVYATELAGLTPASITVDNTNGEAIIALVSMADAVPTTPGAYSSPTAGTFTTQTYIARLSAAGDRFVVLARYGGKSKVCPPGMQCAESPVNTTPTQVLLDGHGNIWIAGSTNATDLPLTPNALKDKCGCSFFVGDGFLAELSSDGTRLLYATYIGSSPNPHISAINSGDDVINSAALDAMGHIWIAGSTTGSDFPVTPNAIQKKGEVGGFISAYDPESNQLLYSTYFGENISAIQVRPDGTAVFVGTSDPSTLPVVATGFTRGAEFVASIDPTFAFSLTGFPDGGTGYGLAFTPTGAAVVAGPNNVLTILQTTGNGAPSIYGIANAAGQTVTGQVAPLELIRIYGANIGPSTPQSANSAQPPTRLAGVQVLVDGVPVHLLHVQSDQIDAILPYSPLVPPFIGDPTTHIVVRYHSADSNEALLGLIPTEPEVFKSGSSFDKVNPFAAALNQDGTVNSLRNPAKPGAIVSVFGSGFGNVLSPPDTLFFEGPLVQLFIVEGLVGVPNEPLEITYAGQAPGLVAGVVQINFRLPSALNEGYTIFYFNVGGWPGGAFRIALKL